MGISRNKYEFPTRYVQLVDEFCAGRYLKRRNFIFIPENSYVRGSLKCAAREKACDESFYQSFLSYEQDVKNE